MKILGIHVDTHDTGCALIEDEKILTVIQEERLSRKKEDSAFPLKSFEKVLAYTATKLSEIDIIAFTGDRPGLKKVWRQWMYKLKPLLFSWKQIFFSGKPLRAIKTLRANWGGDYLLKGFQLNRRINDFMKKCRTRGFKGKLVFIDHDLAHAATAYYTSGFTSCLIPVIEGYSFVNASSIWHAQNGQLQKISDIPWPHSPGSFYRCITAILGFKPRRHAGKITGLAAYGNSEAKNTEGQSAYEKVRTLMCHEKTLHKNHPDNPKKHPQKGLQIKVSPLIYSLKYEYDLDKKLPEYFADFNREDLSSAFQRVLEEVIVDLVREGLGKTGESNLALAGGVAANVKSNQKIADLKEVKEIFVHPGMSDAGQSLGAALQAYAEHCQASGKLFKPFLRLEHVYFGPEPDEKEIEAEIKLLSDPQKFHISKPEHLALEVARLLEQKKVVAICRGRMEYGPRALGNRSILYSPADKSVNDWLNKKLKRTEFMPFAPVTLTEYAAECYDQAELEKSSYTAKFMTICMNCTEKMAKTQPAVVHVDNTARPQLIDHKTNPFYYTILKEFHTLTGLPSLVNTSFNMHEEPIVASAHDAVRAFLDSEIDALVLGDYLIKSK